MNILIPTDFSDHANAALDTSITIAKSIKSDLHIYNSAAIPDDWEDLPVDAKMKDMINKQIALAVRNKLLGLQQKAEDAGVRSYIHYTGGRFIKNLSEVLDKVAIDLIVMGSNGISEDQEYLGSNSQMVIRRFKVNTLIVKKSVQPFLPKSVVFVTDLRSSGKKALREFLEFLEPFNIEKIHILAIDTSSYFSQPGIVMAEALDDFKHVASDFECETHFYHDYTVPAGVRHFVEDYDIDLVGISYKSRNFLKRLFLVSNVEHLVNTCDKPIYCIN